MRVGIFGGTFDPVHSGHLIIAEQVADEMRLEKVIFLPGGIPPHKAASSVRASSEDRFEMVRAATAGNDRFEIDRTEIDSGRAMHSVETVPLLKEKYPGNEWFFITGADEVSNLLTWREPDRLLEEVVMVAATRPGYDLSRLDHLESGLRNFDRIFPVECSRVDISATGIRRRILQGKSIRYMVPAGVFEAIEEKKLYVGELERKTETEVEGDHMPLARDFRKGESVRESTR